MFRKAFLVFLTGFLTCAVQLQAQNDAAAPAANGATPEKPKAGDSPGPNRFWQATLAGGHYMVALDRIASVSRHKYVLDGALLVDEVTVDSVGQALARFYFITPITDAAPGNEATRLADRGRELIDEVAERVGVADVPNMVMKKYPETTHARTIEYRILSERELSALYASARGAWESGRGRQFNGK